MVDGIVGGRFDASVAAIPGTTNETARYREQSMSQGGLASEAIEVVGGAFATAENPARDDYAETIATSFME